MYLRRAMPHRWAAVGRELLQRPLYSDRVLAALALSAREQEDFVSRLDSKDLAAQVEVRTLAHLLLRADSINQRRLDWRRIKVRVKLRPARGPPPAAARGGGPPAGGGGHKGQRGIA